MQEISKQPEALLCTSNFPANTGYAWGFIEGMYAAIADRLAEVGVQTWIAYPRLERPPDTLKGSAAQAIELDTSLHSNRSLRATIRFIRSKNIKVIYFTDRPSRSLAYIALRLAGIRKIVVHDHTSGARSLPTGARLVAKKMIAMVPWICADMVLTVSDFVAKRQKEVGLVPAERVIRVWNSMELPNLDGVGQRRAHSKLLGAPVDRILIVCACRATRYKGVDHLLRAFDSMVAALPAEQEKPFLIYLGDGPQFQELRTLRESLQNKRDILIAGYHSNAQSIVAEADICVVPSLWQEAFGLAVLEAMAYQKAVIASRVGGIPEIVVDGESGLLVPPGDESALSESMRKLICEPEFARRMGAQARHRAAELFSSSDKVLQITGIIKQGFRAANHA